jgi:hypothetical protein
MGRDLREKGMEVCEEERERGEQGEGLGTRATSWCWLRRGLARVVRATPALARPAAAACPSFLSPSLSSAACARALIFCSPGLCPPPPAQRTEGVASTAEAPEPAPAASGRPDAARVLA